MKSICRIAMIACFLTAFTPSLAHAAFKAQQIEGWSVYFDTDMAATMPDMYGRMRTAIRANLHELALRVPDRRVEELRRVPIYVSGKGSNARYSSGSGEGADAEQIAEAGAVILEDP